MLSTPHCVVVPESVAAFVVLCVLAPMVRVSVQVPDVDTAFVMIAFALAILSTASHVALVMITSTGFAGVDELAADVLGVSDVSGTDDVLSTGVLGVVDETGVELGGFADTDGEPLVPLVQAVRPRTDAATAATRHRVDAPEITRSTLGRGLTDAGLR